MTILKDLTRENASEKSWKWTRDIAYLQDEMDEFYEMLNDKGYVLGQPQEKKDNHYGLYEPIEEEAINLLPDLVD